MLTEKVDRARSQKLYAQLLHVIKTNIETGIWKVGSQIPTEDQLCRQFEVSKSTVRLALSELSALGYLKKMQGKGSFVRRKKTAADLIMLSNHNAEWIAAYQEAVTLRLIGNESVEPHPSISGYLQLDEVETCRCLTRLALAGGSRHALQRLYIPHRIGLPSLSAEEMVSLAFPSLLEHGCQIRLHSMREKIGMADFDEHSAAQIGVEPGITALRILQIWYASGDAVAGVAEHLYRHAGTARVLDYERMRL